MTKAFDLPSPIYRHTDFGCDGKTTPPTPLFNKELGYITSAPDPWRCLQWAPSCFVKQREKWRLSKAKTFAEFMIAWSEGSTMADSTRAMRMRQHIIDSQSRPLLDALSCLE